MTEELVLYTNPMSRGRIARWMLEETGAAYRTVILEYGGAMKTPEYLALNPMGKVPTLCHGDAVITEAAAICAYLADAFPDAGLGPPPARRAAYYRWLFFAAGPVEQAVMNRALEVTPPPDKEAMVGYGNYDNVMRTLEHVLAKGDYIAGDTFSAADVYVGAHIGWGMQFGSIEERPAFKAYWARLSDRAACRRASELDDAAMPSASG